MCKIAMFFKKGFKKSKMNQLTVVWIHFLSDEIIKYILGLVSWSK